MNIKLILIFLLLIIVSMNTASASYVWIPYDESDPLPNLGGSTQYNAAPTVFNYNGTLTLINGIQWGNFQGHRWTGSYWEGYGAATSGLPSDIGWRSRPTVFYRDDTWWLISGERYGGWYGYKWGGSSWSANSSVISGIYQSTFYKETSATVFNDNGTWKLISGNEHCIWKGHRWNGASWTQDSSIITGLGDIGSDNTPKVFNDSGTLKLICGASNGNFYGWYWSGSAWVSDSSIVSGLTNVGSNSKPAIFDKDGTLNLLSGCGIDRFYGWTQQEVFSLSGTITNESGAVNNASITLSGSGGSTTSNETGYYEIIHITPGTYSMSVTKELHYDYAATVSITSDTEKNVFLTVIPLTLVSVIAPPPLLPTQEPTPFVKDIGETNEKTFIEEILMFLMTPLTWIFILLAYVGALMAKIVRGDDSTDTEDIIVDISFYGTIGWILVLFINLFIPLFVISEIFSMIIFFVSGFAVATIASGREDSGKAIPKNR